jgi:hypothetical protein
MARRLMESLDMIDKKKCSSDEVLVEHQVLELVSTAIMLQLIAIHKHSH